MWIYFDASMIATTRVYDTPIRQGDIGDQLFVVFANYNNFTGKFVTLQIEYPDHQLSPEVPMIIGDKLYNLPTTGNFTNNVTYNGAGYTFADNSWFEQFGLHKMTIRVYNGVNIQPNAIESTGLFSFNVEKTVFAPNPDISLDQYQYLLSLIEGLQNPTLFTTVAATVINAEDNTLTTGTPVYVSGVVGASGKLRVKRASSAIGAVQSNKLFGVIADPIASGSQGLCVVIGLVGGFTTTAGGPVTPNALVAGEYVFLGTTAGTLTATAPVEPNHRIIVGIAERIQSNTGSIYVRPQIGMDLGELCDVQITTPATGDILRKNGSNIWVNTADLTNAETNITNLQNDKVNKTTTIAGVDLQDNITLNELKTAIGNATTSLAGLMSSTDKTNLDSLIALLATDDLDNFVDTIGEILQIFNNYPEGADLVTALNGKVDKIVGKGLSTNDYDNTEKANVATAYAHSQVADGTNPHATTFANVVNKPTTIGGYGITDAYTKTQIDTSLSGKADIVDGKVPANQLPSFVDDVLEVYERAGATPTASDWFSLTSGGAAITPEAGKIYVIIAGALVNKTYRWSGTQYSIIGDMALGTTAATAFPGDRGLATETKTDNIVSGVQGLTDTRITNSATNLEPLIVNAIASTTQYLQQWQVNNAIRSAIDNNGWFRTNNGLANLTGFENSRVQIATTGTSIIRNVNDTNVPLIVRKQQGTGNILELQTGTSDKKFEIDVNGWFYQNGNRLFTQPVDTTNTFFGSLSGKIVSITGTNNTGFGEQTLVSLTSGEQNVSVGRTALQNVSTGSFNTGIGRASLIATNGSSNSSLGANSGRTITTGSNNTFLGSSAGFTGSWGTQLDTATNSTAIGYRSVTDKDNQMVFGNAGVTEFKFDRNASAVLLAPLINATSGDNHSLERTTTGTASSVNPLILRATSTNDMTDGFGSRLTFQIRDNANVNNDIARIGALRSGADNSGRLSFSTFNAGVETERMTILPDGTIRATRLALRSDSIENFVDAGTSAVSINYNGFNGGATQFRDLLIWNGKEGFIAKFDGTTRSLGIGTTSPQRLLSLVTSSNQDGLQVRRNSDTVGTFSTLGFRVSTTDSATNLAEIRTILTNRAQVADSDITFNTISNFVLGERMRIRDDGNVGIGTNSPSEKLHVVGNARVEGNLTVNGSITTVNTVASTTEQWNITNDGTGPAVTINQTGAQPIMNVQDDGTSVLYVADGGNVGIGTTTPLNKLTVVTASNTTGIQVRRNSATANDYALLGFAITSAGDTADNLAEIRGVRTNREGSGDTDLRFFTNKSSVGITEKMRIRDDGNVGIGTTNPTDKLQVVGSAKFSGNVIPIKLVVDNGIDNDATEIRTGGGEFKIFSGRKDNLHQSIAFATGNNYVSGATRLFIASDGKVGVGTTAPAAILSVTTESDTQNIQIRRNATSGIALLGFRINTTDNISNFAEIRGVRTNRATSTDTDLQFFTRSSDALSEKMRIRDDGLVGINETTLSAQLTVKSGATGRIPLIVDIVDSSTAVLQEWRKNGTANSRITNSGYLAGLGLLNFSNADNATITLLNAGTSISRNIADSNPALIINQIHASSTGDITQFQWQGTTRASIARDGIANFTGTPSNEQTANYTLVLADKGKVLRINSGSATTVTIPLDASVAFPIDTEIAILRYGAGTVSIAGASGVTIRSKNSETNISGQYGSAALKKIETDTWILVGSLE